MSSVKIDVEYYDEKEELLLKENYPEEYEVINKLVKSEVKVPFEDFRVYAIFQNQNPNEAKYNSFKALKNDLPNLGGPFNSYTIYNEGEEKLNSNLTHNNEQTGVSESIGCAGILSFLSYAYDLTDADWNRINIQGHKDFDFDSAVIPNFSKLIVVEAKGSIVKDTSGKKDSKIIDHKSSIKKKKNDESLKKKYSKGVDLLIGGITAIDQKNNVKLWLVDPPSNSELSFSERKKIKLIKRLTYYNSIFLFISKRSNISITLTNRINALSILDDVSQLDNLILINTSREQIKLNENSINNYSHVEKSIIGKFYPISGDLAIFIGLPLELFEIISSQNQQDVLSYKVISFTSLKSLTCKISLSQDRNRKFLAQSEKQEVLAKKDGYASFQTKEVELFQSSSGLNFAYIYSNQIF